MRNIMRISNLVALILAVALVTPSAQAGLLLGNLANGADGTFTGTPDSGDEFATGNATLSITSIDVLWGFGNGGTSNRVGIYTDVGGLPSGTQVGTWFTSGLATTSNTILNYAGSAFLSANTTYHLVIDILDSSEAAYTFNPAIFADTSTLGASNALGSSYGDIQAATWNEDPANLVWQLNGTAGVVPEPATLSLIGLGILNLVSMRRKPA